jgi:TIR domain
MPISVFISYSHESDAHRDRVRGLADSLRGDGVDCFIDQYLEASPPEGWPLWTEKQIEKADFVVLVCTATYHRRVMKEEPRGIGSGATWEANLIYQTLYESQTSNTKFLPVVYTADDLEYVPTPLRASDHYVLDRDGGYHKLYTRITGQPRVAVPDVGKIKHIPSRPPAPLFGPAGGLPPDTDAPPPRLPADMAAPPRGLQADTGGPAPSRRRFSFWLWAGAALAVPLVVVLALGSANKPAIAVDALKTVDVRTRLGVGTDAERLEARPVVTIGVTVRNTNASKSFTVDECTAVLKGGSQTYRFRWRYFSNRNDESPWLAIVGDAHPFTVPGGGAEYREILLEPEDSRLSWGRVLQLFKSGTGSIDTMLSLKVGGYEVSRRCDVDEDLWRHEVAAATAQGVSVGMIVMDCLATGKER